MKNIMTTFLLLAFFATPAFAADNLKIGFVNMKQLLTESTQVAEINAKLQKRFSEPKKQLEDMAKSIQEQEKEIKRNELMMTESKINKSKQDLLARVQEFRQMEARLGQELQAVQNEELTAFRQVVAKVLEDVAKKESYDLILNDGVMYAAKSINITDKILERLNKAN
ncbi:MAG: OmpH family outer membrane protein [Gammaproteobacteria bacterium]|nr:OmpH family outer membrane protein [Gammaproteobacteria bacterium]